MKHSNGARTRASASSSTSTPSPRRGGGVGALNYNFVGPEAVAEQFVPHVAATNDQPVELPVELDLLFLGRIADPLHGGASVVIPAEERAARKNAIRRRGSRANLAAEIMILVASHAVEVVVVHHAHQRRVERQECLDRLQVRQLVDVNCVGMKLLKRSDDAGPGAVLRQREPVGEDCAPVRLAPASARSVEKADLMAAALQFPGRVEKIRLRPSQRTEIFMNEKHSHKSSNDPIPHSAFET